MTTAKQILIALLSKAQPQQRVPYTVTVREAYDNRTSTMEVEAFSKSDAVKEAKKILRDGGNSGWGCKYYFSATKGGM